MAANATAAAAGRVLIRPTATGEWGHTSIIALWVPVVTFAHVFAAFWLFKTFMLNSPSAARRLRRLLGGAPAGASAGAKPAGAAAAAAAPPPAAKGKGAGAGAVAVAATASAAAAIDAAEGGRAGGEPSPFAGAAKGAPAGASEASEVGDNADEVFEALDAAPSLLHHAHSVNVAPSTLEWQGVGCSYNTPTGVKEVLADVWGIAQPGEMQALLGPSGAGKSTFMDILALRKSVGNRTGRLLVNGARASKRFIKKTAYVPQEDNFVPTMTTWEVMSFYADIILPGKWTSARRRERINEVLAEVGLAHAHRTIVGGSLPGGLMMRGLSGGERKRLAIATGILAAPSVLFLDEPTSGLDSFAALTVMGYLKRMVREQSHVVIASIHQPRSAIWLMFDAVTLLASGRLMYHGPREGITPWFGSLGYNYDPSLHGVPSDWALDLVAIGFAKPARFYGNTISTREDLLAASTAFQAHYLQENGLTGSEGAERKPAERTTFGGLLLHTPGASSAGNAAAAAVTAGDDGALAGVREPRGGDEDAGAQKYSSSALKQFRTLFGRELLTILRNPFDVAGRTLTFSWVGIVMGILYYGMPFSANSVRNRMNLVFQLLSFYCLMPYISMGLYSADKKFYLSDASSQLYRPLAYYLAKISAITPFQIVSALVFGWTVYGMGGLRPGVEPVLKNGLISTLMYLIASQVLHGCAVIAPNQDVAFMLSILWTTIQLLLSGFFVNFPEVLLNWITYLRYLSATYYSFEAAAINEFGGMFFSCADGMSPAEVGFLLDAFPNAADTQRNQLRLFFGRADPDCVLDARSVLRYFGMSRPFWMSVTILGSYLLVCHVLTFVAMLVAARRERR